MHNHYLVSGDYHTLYGFLSKINYDLIFMGQGIIDNLCLEQTTAEWEKVSKTPLTPFLIFGCWFMSAVTSPLNNTREGYLFYYPIFQPKWLQNTYTLGGYFWIYYWLRVNQCILNPEIYNTSIFKFMTKVAMWGYLSHYLWIVLLNHLIVKPFNLSFLAGGPIVTFGTFILIPLSYVVLEKVQSLFCSARKSKI